jgi:uncharacterized LabA/DUF88 family protein
MIVEPPTKRAMAFFDGQNIFYAAKEAFGYPYPNYDPHKLATTICSAKGWSLAGIRFYTGIPDLTVDPNRHRFWSAKLAVMGTRGIRPFTRPLRYQNKVISLPNGQITTVQVGREKGIDVRIALDVVRFALENRYDVAVIFSQDQDLSEAVDDVRTIALREQRWIKVACAFSLSPTSQNHRGINKTDWIPIDRAIYDACIDPVDYRGRRVL